MKRNLIDVAAEHGVEFDLVGIDYRLTVEAPQGAPVWLLEAITANAHDIRQWLRWQRIESRLNRPLMADDADDLRAELAAMGLSDSVTWERTELTY